MRVMRRYLCFGIVCAGMRINRRPINLLIQADLIQKARDHGLIISKFLENKLQEYFSFLNAVSNANSKGECGRRDLNPSFKLGKLK